MTTAVTKGPIGAQDQNLWDGVTGTFTRTSSTGATETLNKVGAEVDALMVYGGGVNYTSTTIKAALTAIGTTNPVTLVLRAGTWTKVGSDTITFTPNITLKMYGIFSGFAVGNITGLTEAFPQWWGGGPSASAAANLTAINSALAASRNVTITDGDWSCNEGLLMNVNGQNLKGTNEYLSNIVLVPTGAGAILITAGLSSGGDLAHPYWQPVIENITLSSADTTYTKTAIKWLDVHQGKIRNIRISGFNDSSKSSIGIHWYGRDENVLENPYISADIPQQVSQDPILPATPYGLEYAHFRNISSAAVNTKAHIEVDSTLSLASFVMDGYNVFSGGLHGIHATAMSDDAVPISIENVVWDRPGANSGWFVYIDTLTHAQNRAINLRNLITYTGTFTTFNGYYVDGADLSLSTFDNLSYGAGGTTYGGQLSNNPKVLPLAFAALTTGSSTSSALIDRSSYVPSGARYVFGYVWGSTAGTVGKLGSIDGLATGYVLSTGTGYQPFWLPLLTDQSLWYLVSGGGNINVVIGGYGF